MSMLKPVGIQAPVRRCRGFVPALLPCLVFVVGAHATTPASLDLHGFEAEAGRVFDRAALLSGESGFEGLCGATLMMMQAVSAVIIVAGLLIRMRRTETQMEGVATMLVKVGFIATLTLWRSLTIETGDAMAAALGYQPVSAERSPPLLAASWSLLAEWVPPGSPYLDTLDAQTAVDAGRPDDEAEWVLRAWNWARGFGVASDEQFHAAWQAVSGSIRAMLVFGCCCAVAVLAAMSIMAQYLAEILRSVLVGLGFAMAPVFVAGLGIDALRALSTRYLVGLAALAFWPVGWAATGSVSTALVTSVIAWMDRINRVALTMATEASPPPFSVAAPYLGWGVLLFFAALSAVLCAWTVGSLAIVPILFGRAAFAVAGNAAAGEGARSVSPAFSATAAALPRGPDNGGAFGGVMSHPAHAVPRRVPPLEVQGRAPAGETGFPNPRGLPNK